MPLKHFPGTEAGVITPGAGRPGNREQGVRLFWWILTAGLLLLLFAKLAEDVAFHEINAFDGAITHLIRQYTSPPATVAMKAFTMLGSAGAILPAAAGAIIILALLKRPLPEIYFLAAATAGSSLLVELLKWAFHRPRPDLNQLIHAAGYSFPSGHSTVGLAFYGAVAYLIWSGLPRPPLRWCAAAAFALLSLAIGASRIYLGVHYPSDVLAGFAAGGTWLAGCITAHQAAVYRRSNMAVDRKTLKH